MPASNSSMIRKLQIALNSRGAKLLCNRSQFYSDQQHRPVTIYKICQSVWNSSTEKYNHVELFSSASEIQCVLFLRNLWYAVNCKPIPPTNKMKGSEFFERSWKAFEEAGLEQFIERCNNSV